LKVFKTLFDSVRLVAYHHDRLFGFDFVQGKVDRVGEHGKSQKGMENLHQIRLHPGSLSCCKNNSRNPFQTSIPFNPTYHFYTMTDAFSQPRGILPNRRWKTTLIGFRKYVTTKPVEPIPRGQPYRR